MNYLNHQIDTSILLQGEEVKQAAVDFFVPLATSRHLNVKKFDVLIESVTKLAEMHKNQEFVAKSVLRNINTTIGVLRNEAPNCGQQGQMMMSMADRLQTIFNMILSGETPRDRQPGVPRIL